MKKVINKLLTLLIGSFLLLMAKQVSAVPFILSVDMDPLKAGIQNTLTVIEGDSFEVNLRVRELSPPFGGTFSDNMQMIISFNDSGLILAGGPLTWEAGLSTFPLTTDLITGNLVDNSNNAVGRSIVPGSSILPGYASNSGIFGLLPPILVPFANFNGADDTGPLLSMQFSTQVGFTGSSRIIAHGQQNTPLIGNRDPFTFLGVNLPTLLDFGTVKVIAKDTVSVPEPGMILLFSSGFIGLIGYQRRYL